MLVCWKEQMYPRFRFENKNFLSNTLILPTWYVIGRRMLLATRAVSVGQSRKLYTVFIVSVAESKLISKSVKAPPAPDCNKDNKYVVDTHTERNLRDKKGPLGYEI